MLRTIVVSPEPSTIWGSSSEPVETKSVIDSDRLLSLAVALHRIVFAQRMAFPLVRQHDAAQVGVPGKADAEEIEDLALVEVSRRPDMGNAIDDWIVAGQKRPQPDALLHGVRKNVIADLKARFARVPIDRGHVFEEVVACGLNDPGRLTDVIWRNGEGEFVAVPDRVDDRLALPGQKGSDRRICGVVSENGFLT